MTDRTPPRPEPAEGAEPDKGGGPDKAPGNGLEPLSDPLAELPSYRKQEDDRPFGSFAGLVVGSSQPAGIDTLEDEAPVFGAGSGGLSGPGGSVRVGDRVMRAVTTGAGGFVVILIGLIAVFLLIKALPALTADHSNFITSRNWDVDSAVLNFGVLPLLWVTVLISLLAMVIAVPIAIGIALFITQYASSTISRPIAYIIDLLAAIPSIIYGIWGIAVLAPRIQPFANFVSGHFGWFPLLKNENVQGGTIFTGGVVLAVMILPIVTAVTRDVFERTPRANIEAAWALGATRWEMIRLAVLPYGRPGLVSGAMLGLGRALGETIAISLILSKVSDSGAFSFSIFNGGETFASKIANNAAEFNSPKQTGAFIAAGLVLFVLTFAVNATARAIVNRRKEFS